MSYSGWSLVSGSPVDISIALDTLFVCFELLLVNLIIQQQPIVAFIVWL